LPRASFSGEPLARQAGRETLAGGRPFGSALRVTKSSPSVWPDRWPHSGETYLPTGRRRPANAWIDSRTHDPLAREGPVVAHLASVGYRSRFGGWYRAPPRRGWKRSGKILQQQLRGRSFPAAERSSQVSGARARQDRRKPIQLESRTPAFIAEYGGAGYRFTTFRHRAPVAGPPRNLLIHFLLRFSGPDLQARTCLAGLSP